MKDIEDIKDIEKMLKAFYSKIISDDLIGHFFTEIIPLNLEIHIPIIAAFWETVLFATKGYGNDVMAMHRHIHQLSTIRKEHFDRWVEVFSKTIDEHFTGTRATLMKQRALSIATMMNLKLNHDQIKKL